MRVFYANVDVFNETKRIELYNYIFTENIQIVALVEVFPKCSFDLEIYKKLLIIEGFETVWPENLNILNRGIVFLVKKGIFFEIEKFSCFNESLALRFNFSGKLYRIGLIYRSPSNPDFDGLTAFTREFFSLGGPSMLVGDFNMPKVDWRSLTGLQNDSEQFLKIIRNLYIDQIVDKCTRFRIGNAPSKLDLYFI